ncbi:MAG TPA: ABC transporter permease [Thermoplasmata archaeon]|nr:ABC transporter permease [Thermoplasmata archaeon]
MTRGRTARLPHRRLQTILAIAALGTAVALPVVLLSVGGGVFDHEIGDLRASGYQIAVSAGGVHGVDGAHGLSRAIRGIHGVAWSSPVLSAAVDTFTSQGTSPALAEGIVPGAFTATLGPTEASLFPSPLPLGDPSDAVHFANGSYSGPSAGRVLVSTPLAASQHLRVGDTLRLAGADDPAEAVAFTVAGTFGVAGVQLGPTAVFGLLLPLSDLQLLVGEAHGPGGSPLDAADTVDVALTASAAASPAAVDEADRAIHALVPYYSVVEVSDQATQLQNAQAVLTGFYLGLSAVGLVVGLAFLALLLQREVEMERRSIGIRRALGIPARSIAWGILSRGYLLALAGGTAGVVLGIALVVALADYAGGTVSAVARLAVFDPTTLGLLVLAVVATSGLAGGLAARAALALPVAEVLR